MEDRLAGWKRELQGAHRLIAGLFGRSEVRGRSLLYMQGLLSGCERKNGWQMAEWMGEASPYAMQHLLDRARWDADAARDRVREYVVEALGSPDAVLIVDETGFVKKGVRSAGVKRQYSGTAGRIENSQVGVFLGYASEKGAALVDRALYVPQEWAEDRERCRAAGIPDTVEFATKPELARQMIGRALDAGVPVGWVAGDEVYGSDSKVRRMLEARQVSYVLAAACNQHLWRPDFEQQRVDAIAQSLPKRAWKRLSAGSGSKGERLYDWALVRLSEQQGWARTLLVRRSIGEKLEHAFYLCYAPTLKSTLAALVRVAGQRWQIEQCFETAKAGVPTDGSLSVGWKGECGLDHYEVRHWQGWQRHITLAMLAHAVLAVLRGRGEKNSPWRRAPQRARSAPSAHASAVAR
jgi:SRSO17 transposase